jgi:hypothetical protein
MSLHFRELRVGSASLGLLVLRSRKEDSRGTDDVSAESILIAVFATTVRSPALWFCTCFPFTKQRRSSDVSASSIENDHLGCLSNRAFSENNI